MSKTLCKHKKQKIVEQPRFKCEKCGGKVKRKKEVCKPGKL